MPIKTENPWVGRIVSGLFAVIMAVSSWFLSQTMNKMCELESRIYKIEINNATTAGNRFTAVDWQANKLLLDADRQQLEKRTIVLEQNFLSVRELLGEIKSDIKSLRAEHYGKVD